MGNIKKRFSGQQRDAPLSAGDVDLDRAAGGELDGRSVRELHRPGFRRRGHIVGPQAQREGRVIQREKQGGGSRNARSEAASPSPRPRSGSDLAHHRDGLARRSIILPPHMLIDGRRLAHRPPGPARCVPGFAVFARPLQPGLKLSRQVGVVAGRIQTQQPVHRLFKHRVLFIVVCGQKP